LWGHIPYNQGVKTACSYRYRVACVLLLTSLLALFPALFLAGCGGGPQSRSLDVWIVDWNADTRTLLSLIHI